MRIASSAPRTGHPGPFVNAAFPGLEVLGVDDETAEALLRSHARDLTPADRRRIRQEARGNPLALLELPAAWAESHSGESHAPTLSARRGARLRGADLALPGRHSRRPARCGHGLLERPRRDTGGDGGLQVRRHGLQRARGGRRRRARGGRQRNADLPSPVGAMGILQTETVVRRQAAHRALAMSSTPTGTAVPGIGRIDFVGPDDRVADRGGAAGAGRAVVEARGRLPGLSALVRGRRRRRDRRPGRDRVAARLPRAARRRRDLAVPVARMEQVLQRALVRQPEPIEWEEVLPAVAKPAAAEDGVVAH